MSKYSFCLFHYTKKSCERCWNACDTPTMINQSYAKSNDTCIETCEFWCWPLCITFDILSCPCRLSYYTYHNISCKCKTCCKKKKPSIAIEHYNVNDKVNNNVINTQPNNS
jgi:hypothetical protein